MLAKEALDRLLEHLHARDILLTEDDIGWAFNSPKTVNTVVDFVSTRINDDNLLTLEEKETYEKLRSQLSRVEGFSSSVLPLTETLIREDSSKLEAATKQLKDQTAILRKQKAELLAITSLERQQETSLKHAHSQRKRKYDAEKQQLTIAVDEAVTKLNNLTTQQERRKPIASTVQGQKLAIHESLKSDDRLLERLQAILNTTTTPDQIVLDGLISRIKTLSQKLVQLRTSAIRMKLCRTYLAQFQDNGNGHNEAHSQPMHLVLDDLNAFHHDIPDVAEMTIRELYLDKMLPQLRKNHMKKKNEAALRCEQVTSTLLQLSERNIAMMSAFQRDQSRYLLQASLLEQVNAASKAPAFPNPKSDDRSVAKKTILNYPTTPIKGSTRFANSTNSSSSEIQMKRLLGLQAMDKPSDVSVTKLQDFTILENNYTTLTNSEVNKVMFDIGAKFRDLESLVLKDSQWHGSNVNLIDEDIAALLEQTDIRVRNVGQQVGTTWKDAQGVNDGPRETFLKQWS